MHKWRRIWREGLAPQLSSAGLRALQSALFNDDIRLVQGVTCFPPPLDLLGKCAVGGACAIGFSGWQGDGLTRIEQVDAYFVHVCDVADAALHEAAGCRYFLNWFDETPRAEMRRELLAEVNLALAMRTRNAA